MKLIDKKGKLFGVINAIDAVIALIIIVIAAGAVYKFAFMDKTSTVTPMEPVTYTVEIKKVRSFTMDNVKEGDTLFDTASGSAIGKITKIDYTTAKEPMGLLDGTMIMAEVENRYDVLFTVEAEASTSGDVYYINRSYEVVVGSTREFATKYSQFEGKVKEILP